MLADSVDTWIQLIQKRAEYQPDKAAYIFLQNGEKESDRLTYRQLYQRSQAIAASLQTSLLQGERAILLYPPGLDFITAFYGCLLAGIIAVPANLPHPKRPFSRVNAIIADASATAVLTTSAIKTKLLAQTNSHLDLSDQNWWITDQINDHCSEDWKAPQVTSDDLAFLQYTSGSTGIPKGVIVTHRNILHNQQAIQQAFEHNASTIMLSWLPLFHDMGLIGHVLQPFYLGIPSILMPPLVFLQRPWRWLKAISHYRATTSGAPNFAYQKCIEKITPKHQAELDLSCWEIAFNGSEPVQEQTMTKFAEVFAPCGFRPEVFYPCYGSAEATLFITGGNKRTIPTVNRKLETHSVVSCGKAWAEQTLAIANPETLNRCLPGEVGEIWVKGQSIASGYWNRPQLSQEAFQAYLGDSKEGPFLRTGDLGFIQEGELYVTGRLKEVIILKGKNYYPHDLEATVVKSHEALLSQVAAAFTTEIGGEEQLVILQEVKRQYLKEIDGEEVIAAIATSIMTQHGLRAYDIWLLAPGTLPKTSSGKLQRYRCREGFLNKTFQVLADGKSNLSLGRNR